MEEFIRADLNINFDGPLWHPTINTLNGFLSYMINLAEFNEFPVAEWSRVLNAWVIDNDIDLVTVERLNNLIYAIQNLRNLHFINQEEE